MKSLIWQLLERTRDLTWFIIATFLIYTFIFVPTAKADDMVKFHKVLSAECVSVLNRDSEHIALVERIDLMAYKLIEGLPKDLENRIIRLKVRVHTVDNKSLSRGSAVMDSLYCGVNVKLGLVYSNPKLFEVVNFVRTGLPKGLDL